MPVAQQALKDHPADTALINSFGNLFMQAGEPAQAAEYFAKAAQLEPQTIDFALNHAIALTAQGHNEDAIAVMVPLENQGRSSALFCSARGNAERGAGNLDAAAVWYDRAIALEPRRAKALHGRARIAIERGEADARQRFDAALAVNQGDPDLWLGRAQTLEVEGDIAGARQIAQSLVDQAPQWLEGSRYLAALRLAQGEADPTSHYGSAIAKLPQDPNIPYAWCGVLGSLDDNAKAADIAAEARKAHPDTQQFALLEALHSGAAGDDDRAEAIFKKLTIQNAERWLHEARHRIRLRDCTQAVSLLEQVLEADPDSISAWALLGVAWRLMDSPNADWLYRQGGCTALLPLPEADAVLPRVIPILHELHDGSPLPLGQSLRGGTQTRGILFNRLEPELRELQRSILDAVEQYRAGLPPADDRHPLLRHRDAPWRMEGSWSVRLAAGGDYHAAHIHPQGLVSSALYLELPPEDASDPKAGWLELGRPASDLRTGLEPLETIEPRIGHLALFPSILYHGTRPFSGAQRMTVAFDISLRKGTA